MLTNLFAEYRIGTVSTIAIASLMLWSWAETEETKTENVALGHAAERLNDSSTTNDMGPAMLDLASTRSPKRVDLSEMPDHPLLPEGMLEPDHATLPPESVADASENNQQDVETPETPASTEPAEAFEDALVDAIHGDADGTEKIAKVTLPQAGSEQDVLRLLRSGVAVLEISANGVPFVSIPDRTVQSLADVDFRRATASRTETRSKLRFTTDNAYAANRLTSNLYRLGVRQDVDASYLVITSSALEDILELQNSELTVDEDPQDFRLTICFEMDQPKLQSLVPAASGLEVGKTCPST